VKALQCVESLPTKCISDCCLHLYDFRFPAPAPAPP
jgi:hypothetical protein